MALTITGAAGVAAATTATGANKSITLFTTAATANTIAKIYWWAVVYHTSAANKLLFSMPGSEPGASDPKTLVESFSGYIQAGPSTAILIPYNTTGSGTEIEVKYTVMYVTSA